MFPEFSRPRERSASSSRDNYLASCLCLDTAEASGKSMCTCCPSLRGLVKLSGMRSSQLFNLLGRKAFCEDNNMLSLMYEEPAWYSWLVGALILKGVFFLFFPLEVMNLCNSVFLTDASKEFENKV